MIDPNRRDARRVTYAMIVTRNTGNTGKDVSDVINRARLGSAVNAVTVGRKNTKRTDVNGQEKRVGKARKEGGLDLLHEATSVIIS